MRDDLTVVYFTSNREDQGFEAKVRSTILSSCRGLPIVSVSQQPLEFGHNICIGDVGASPANILRQVMIGTVLSRTRFVVLCEADGLYPPSYFTFQPPRDDIMYHNDNIWVGWRNRPVFRPKRRYDVNEGYAGRECLMELVHKAMNHPQGYDTPTWMRSLPHESFHTSEPVITVITGNGLHRASARTKPEVRELPYWGSSRSIWRRYG